MYKDRYPASHHLSFSAVTSYQTSNSNPPPYQRYQGKQPIEQLNNHYRSSVKNEGNSDLAFLRNTVGPISSVNGDNNYLKPNDGKKFDVSLRQTMNVTSDFRDKIKLSSPLNQKRSQRAQTVNENQTGSTSEKKNNKEDDRLQRIMNKYEKKNETKQALKLLQQLKQLKKKQQQLKKQRKNEPQKEQQSIIKGNGYDFNSPINFSKKNKVDYYTPTYQKKQLSTNTNSPQNQHFFNAKNKKAPYDIAKEQIFININSNPYKPALKDQESLNLSVQNLSISSSNQNNKSSSNLKSYYQNSQTYKNNSPSTTNQYSFTKTSSKYDQKQYQYNNTSLTSSSKYASKVSQQSYSIKPSILSVTTRDNSIVNKSPNSKISPYRQKNSKDFFASSVTYSNPKSYSQFDSYDMSSSRKVNTNNTNSTPFKDVFANRKLTINDFVLGKNLGEGKFGTVFQAYDKKTKSLYALKKIPKSIIKSHWMVDQFILEVKIQSFLNHPNILSLHGCFDDYQHVYILLQYMQQGTLFLHLKKNTILCEREAAIKLKQMASAIQYLHQNGIAHRDLKPQNIVMSHGVSKLCDFGWATLCDERRKTYCGTFDYAAPQILQGTQYDMSVDLWCLGILAYEILVGKAPFYHISRKQTMKKIMNCQNEKINYPSTMSYEAKSFIEQLLRKNPEERLKSEELLNHPFFKLAE